MKYLEWNSLIGEYFFNPSNAGKEVLLYITKKEISELGIKNFGFASEAQSWDDYCKAIKSGFPEIYSKTTFIDKFLVVSNKWKYYEKVVFESNNKYDLKIEGASIYSPNLKVVYPFYLGFLVSLVVPLTDNVNSFRANAFFPPLDSFLVSNKIVTANNKTKSIADIDWVWNNLENWSKALYKTDLGYFTERHLGNPNWLYVGKPYSQCLLSPRNIRDIPNIFWAAGIAPFSIITESHFLRIINLYSESKAGFDNRIKNILKDEDNLLKKVIVDIVKREYENWKGYVIEYDERESNGKPKSGWVYGTLISAFTLNREDEIFTHFYYLHSLNDFPEELNLGGHDIKNLDSSFSSPINIPFNQELNLTDDQNKWRASATKNEITLYSSGSYFGLPSSNFVETDKISRQSTMYLLCAGSKKQVVEEWGSTFAKGDFNPVNYDNIPLGFTLYKFRNPVQSHPTEEILKITTKKKVELRGGIKLGNREYLKNMLPSIYIEGADGTEKIYFEFKNENRVYLLKNLVVPEEFIIPTSVVCNQQFLIKDENGILDNCGLGYQITDIDFNPLDILDENLTKRDRFGEICEGDKIEFVIGSNTHYNNWQRQLACIPDFYSNTYIRAPFKNNLSEYKLERGNLVLQILSSKRNLHYEEFSEILDCIEDNSRLWELSRFQQSPKYIKQTSISLYDYLGFLDYDYSLNKISINRPQFAIIPSKSSLRGILIGARSKSFIDDLQDCCIKYSVNLEIIPQESQLDVCYLPDLIRLIPADCNNSTEAWMKLNTIASIMNIEFRTIEKPYRQPQIMQFGLQDFSETVDGYKQHLLQYKNVEKANYEWARKVFDINALKFVKDDNPIDKTLSLQEYYVQYQYSYILWLDNKSYEVDRNWGKFLFLSEKKKHVIFYNERTKELAVPKYIQLPRLFAESIILLSGQAPYFKNITIDKCELIYQFHQNVPKIFAENLFKKFNQQMEFNNDL
ncbi:hypothetical protein A4H97_33320 [Niastella yeongjuensis]|uniref:Uncharacterized protein n=1 Tax=Niastella yeongjuensis TaxID=354355 RepID=A0A1V9EDP3_9BACT|nr:hypothetical protein [Niastella yeongjuensis]OQP44236.1 hypothetical protein A4H97_33320 [Niastella yeongjuensis]SEO40608.1 hypothetical protein SAMN05660816_02838 [Niastella yeongjuensis]